MLNRYGWEHLRLLSPESVDPGGGGNDPPKALTEEDIARIANAAVTSQLKREIPKAFEGLKLGEQIENAIKAAMPAPATPIEPKPADPTKSPEMAALLRQVEELKTSAKTEREARLSAEAKQRDERAQREISAGIDTTRGEFKDVLGEYLFRRVSYDEAGNALLNMTGDPNETPLPLKDGITNFLKSKAAAPYLPAPAASGDAARRAGSPPARAVAPGQSNNGIPVYDKPATDDTERMRRAQERTDAIQAQLTQR